MKKQKPIGTYIFALVVSFILLWISLIDFQVPRPFMTGNAQARIISSEYVYHLGKGGSPYYQIDYTYTVSGKDYRGSTQFDATKDALTQNKYRPGSTVNLHYLTASPSANYIDGSYSSWVLPLYLLVVVAFIWIGIYLHAISYRNFEGFSLVAGVGAITTVILWLASTLVRTIN